MDSGEARTRVNKLLVEADLTPLDDETAAKIADYLSLFVRWNGRINLSSVRDEEAILSRHLIEAIEVAQTLPHGIVTLLDFGSGGGLPGIPITLCRPEIAVTLAESQGKKAAFLQEAVRVLGLKAQVHAGRAEDLRNPFDCVVLRAVDKMPKAVAAAAQLVAPAGWLGLMTTNDELAELKVAAGGAFVFENVRLLAGSTHRILALARRGL